MAVLVTKIQFPVLIYVIASWAKAINAFAPSASHCKSFLPSSPNIRQHELILNAQQNEAESERLLLLLSNDERSEDEISNSIFSLESTQHANSTLEEDDTNKFGNLIDLYEVKHVLSSNKKDNPVGGKWTRSNGLAQKLFRTRKTFQHLLPYNTTGLSLSRSIYAKDAVAEAINVISLEAFGDLLRASVILRGDAVPLTAAELTKMNNNRTLTKLSNLAVRAYFDPPRIIFGKRTKSGYSYLPLQLGPISSVVLDTTYSDSKLRIGMGGTSGTRFVFARTNDQEAKEYEKLLVLPLVKKVGVMCKLGLLMGLSLYVAGGNGLLTQVKRWMASLASVMPDTVKFASTLFEKVNIPLVRNGLRVLAGITSCVTGLLMLLISFSSGGIERDELSRTLQ